MFEGAVMDWGSVSCGSQFKGFPASDGVAEEGTDIGFVGRPWDCFAGGRVDDFQVGVTPICRAHFKLGQAVADEVPEGFLLLIDMFRGPVDCFSTIVAMAIIPEPALWMEGTTFVCGGCGAEGFYAVDAAEILGREFRAPSIHKDKIPASIAPGIPIGHEKPTRNVLRAAFDKTDFNAVRELDALAVRRTGTQEGGEGHHDESQCKERRVDALFHGVPLGCVCCVPFPVEFKVPRLRGGFAFFA